MSGISGSVGKEMFTRLLGKYGSSTEVTLTSFPASTFDILTQERTDGTPVITPLVAMISEYDDNEIDDSLILEGDLRIDVYSGVIIDKTMRIDIGTATYRIINIKKVKPATKILGYQLQVRR